MSNYHRNQLAKKVPPQPYSWQEDNTIQDNIHKLFVTTHAQLNSRSSNLALIRQKFKGFYKAAEETQDKAQLFDALLEELDTRLSYKERDLSPSKVDRAAIELLQEACQAEPSLIPQVINRLTAEKDDWAYKLNNLICIMESPAAVMNFFLGLYKKTENLKTQQTVCLLIRSSFQLYKDELSDDSYSFFGAYLYEHLQEVNLYLYSEKTCNFFESLDSCDVKSIITLIREGILQIPSEEANELASRVKSQVIAEILDTEYNDHAPNPHNLYTPEMRHTFLEECAQANSRLRKFSDIPTTWCFWKKNKQTKSSRTLQQRAETEGITWESNDSLQTQTTSNSASSSSSSFFLQQTADPYGTTTTLAK